MGGRFGAAVLSLCLWAQALPASSTDADGNFVIKGEGAALCRDYLAATEQSATRFAAFAGYVAGYTSAYNQMQPDTFDVWRWQTIDTVMLLLLQNCRLNKDQSFAAAVAGVTAYLAALKLSSAAEMVRLGDENDGFHLYEPVFDELVSRLESLGYDARDPFAALMKYKSDNDLPDAKNQNQMLLLRLFSDAPRPYGAGGD